MYTVVPTWKKQTLENLAAVTKQSLKSKRAGLLNLIIVNYCGSLQIVTYSDQIYRENRANLKPSLALY